MTETPFTGVDGRFVKMPPRNVVPKPVQKPHPPLWVACSRRETILLAAEKGIGSLTFAFIDPEEAVHWVGDYEATLAERCVPVGEHVNANVACVTPMMCAPTEEVAIERGLEGGNFFGYSLGHYYIFGDHVPGTTDVWKEFIEKRAEQGYSPDVAAALAEERLGAKVASGDTTGLRGATGTPEQIREYLLRFEEAGVDQLIFVMQAGKNRHEDICEAHRAVRQGGAPRVQGARRRPGGRQGHADGADHRGGHGPQGAHGAPTLPDGYHFPAMPRKMVDDSGSKEGKEWLEKFAESSATGEALSGFQINQ